MAKLNFNSKNVDLFERIIKIVRKHDGNFTAMQDDFETTKLIMKEIEKWEKRKGLTLPVMPSELIPLSAPIIQNKMESLGLKNEWSWIKKERAILGISEFLENFAKETDEKVMGGLIKSGNRHGYLKPHRGTINAGEETFYDFKRPKK